MMARRLAPFLALVLVVVAGAPAQAADELSVSRDGVTWTDAIVDPLFDPDIRWVPGDERQVRFFVRNESADSGRLTIDVEGVEVDGLLETGDLAISARGGDGSWMTVDEPGTKRLVTRVLPSSGVESVDIEVRFDPASTNISELKMQDLRFRATLSQASVADDEPSDAGGILPSTGATRGMLSIAAIGCLLLLVGSSIVARRKEVSHG